MREVEEATLPEQVGVLIKETQSVLHQRMDEVLRPLGLTVPQYACLETLWDSPGITAAELARRAFVSRQSMNVVLQGLEKRGLIERSEEPGPQRERATVLRVSAVRLRARAHGEVARVVGSMTADLDAAEVARLLTLLTTCRDALRAE